MSNKQGVVSIIIPTFNRSQFIVKTLKSVANQSYKDWECLIIDDGSTDDTFKVVRNYIDNDKRFKYYKRPSFIQKGANACRNYGLSQSQGAYINWFDDDDIMHADKIRLQIEALQNSEYGFCVCQSVEFEGTIDNIIGLKSETITSEDPFSDYLQMKIVWLTQSPIFKKSFLISNNFTFNETLLAAQEWELFSRILFKCPEYEVVNMPLVYLRVHSQALSTQITKDLQREWYYVLARNSIFNLMKNELSLANINYLRGYGIHYFKLFLKHKLYKRSWFIFSKMFLLKPKAKLDLQLKMALALMSYAVFNKGHIFLSRLKL